MILQEADCELRPTYTQRSEPNACSAIQLYAALLHSRLLLDHTHLHTSQAFSHSNSLTLIWFSNQVLTTEELS